MYLFVSSDDCKDLYPENSAVNFTVELPQALTGNFIALQHVFYKKQEKEVKGYYYVLCDNIQSSVLGGKEVKVLGSFFETGSLQCPQELPLVNHTIKRLNIRLLTRTLKVPTNLSTIYLTLKIF